MFTGTPNTIPQLALTKTSVIHVTFGLLDIWAILSQDNLAFLRHHIVSQDYTKSMKYFPTCGCYYLGYSRPPPMSHTLKERNNTKPQQVPSSSENSTLADYSHFSVHTSVLQDIFLQNPSESSPTPLGERPLLVWSPQASPSRKWPPGHS